MWDRHGRQKLAVRRLKGLNKAISDSECLDRWVREVREMAGYFAGLPFELRPYLLDQVPLPPLEPGPVQVSSLSVP